MKHLHLFTPVYEGLPELTGWYLTDLGPMYFDGHVFISSNGIGNVHHWLDLSKLTTKERAIELVGNCVMNPDQSNKFISEL